MKQENIRFHAIPTTEEVKAERERLEYRSRYGRVLRSTIYALLVVAAAAVLLATLLLPVLQVSGDSMNPTLEDKDILVLVKHENMETGDLCAFYWQNKLLIKRIIGAPGDVITLGGAVFFAIQMAVTAKYGRKMDINVITFWMFVGNGVLSLVSSLLFETQAPASVWTPSFIGVMAFLSVGCTCVALLIQNVGLAHVPASTGSLLLSMESPSGVLFSVLLMGEALTSRLLAGFALIFLSIILSETHFDFLRRKPRPQL